LLGEDMFFWSLSVGCVFFVPFLERERERERRLGNIGKKRIVEQPLLVQLIEVKLVQTTIRKIRSYI
jgi:hypothetical protein